jgi:hypothetical protein
LDEESENLEFLGENFGVFGRKIWKFWSLWIKEVKNLFLDEKGEN